MPSHPKPSSFAVDTKNHVPVTMVELVVEPGTTVTQDLPGSYNGFLLFWEGQVLWLERGTVDEKTEVKIHAEEKLHIMLYAGQPVGEKVVARGPFVMNSEEEIVQAYKGYKAGKFE